MKNKPIKIFLLLCITFLIAEYQFNLIAHHYTWVHFYFGLSAPLLVGYLSITLFRQLLIQPQIRVWYWSMKSGIVITFIISFVNEVIDDPIQNGIHFFDAWHHFAADTAGIIVFLLIFQLQDKLKKIDFRL